MSEESGVRTLDLSGEWKLTWSDGQRGCVPDPVVAAPEGMIDAQVPGEIHLDLWRAGVISDPYAGLGCLEARWVEEYIWYYRREFDAPEDLERAWLVFEELDLTARVYLNGELIGSHHNFFRPCWIDVSKRVLPGRNLLVVQIESGLYEVSDRQGAGYGINQHHRHVELTKRHWLRKPSFQFTWDWSTRLINVGISGPVRLEWTEQPVRLDRVVALAATDEDLRHARVTVRAFAEGLSDVPVDCRLEATVEGGTTVGADIKVAPGLHSYEVVLDVQDPDLWWPIGVGPQSLSEVTATISTGDRVIGSAIKRVGFRTVRFDQSPDPAGGTRFILEVNGRPVFCKGANLVPSDMIMQRIDRNRYEKLVDLAVEANFNFLRVWGGGLYEPDDFYDLCDERGILVWQEFSFACSRFPATDPGFYDEVKLEATHQVRRLAHHASLIAWCGNNEIEEGYWNWGFDRGVVFPDYSLYHLVLPRILAQEDPTRYYQPSSPWSPDGTNPRNDMVGDQHPWTVGFANGDFRDYRKMISRFPNEGGIQGPTALATMRECLQGGPEQVHSFAWRIHDNSNGPHADVMLDLWLGLDSSSLRVEEYTYWAGLIHGEGLREYCENFRRRMFSSACAAFWMYNDCWPATRSWTIVDYRLRRTPAFAPVQRAMAPVAIVVAEDPDAIRVFGVNDTNETIEGHLRYGLLELGGAYPLDRETGAVLQPNASTLLAEFALTEWSDQQAIAFGLLTDSDGRLISRGRLIRPLFKDIDWPESKLDVRVEGGVAIFESDTFCWGVCLDLEGEEPLADNFFDVWPGVPHAISWAGSEPPRVLRVGNTLPQVAQRR